MELGRFLVEAVVLGGQSPNQLARTHPISRSWLFRLLARYKQGGPAAIEPRSHRPKACPHQISPVLEAAILELRRELSTAGFDAGPQTILHHLAERFQTVPSRPSLPLPSHSAIRRNSSATTRPYSVASPAAAGLLSSPSSTAWASFPSTQPLTTLRLAARSNAFTRPSRSSSLDRRRLSPSPTSSSSSTSFATATTSNDLTAPSMAALPSRPSMLGSKPRLRSRASLFNTASAATWSTLPVLSPSAL